MCPACIENAAVMAAGVGSAGGILAVCINKVRKLLGTTSIGLFQKIFISGSHHLRNKEK
jgi:hypothetical protein